MRVRFSIEAAHAEQVLLAGDFTEWEANARKMRKSGPRARTFAATVSVPPGEHQYKFIVDGAWVTDPKAACVPNPFGTENSVIDVS
jgi:1,4-alpha-glucan branching enzyme